MSTCEILNVNVTTHNSCNHGSLHLWLQSLELRPSNVRFHTLNRTRMLIKYGISDWMFTTSPYFFPLQNHSKMDHNFHSMLSLCSKEFRSIRFKKKKKIFKKCSKSWYCFDHSRTTWYTKILMSFFSFSGKFALGCYYFSKQYDNFEKEELK